MGPKKKGKGKGDKLARMTVEQRQAYLDRKAAQEAEAIRRREELVAGFFKLKLSDEEKKGGVNEAKLMSKWREVLRETKTTSLRNSLKELRAKVGEATTSQDNLIQLLASQVGQAHHQRSTAAHNHLSAVHKLTGLHEEHVGMLSHYLRLRQAGITLAMADDTEKLAARHLHSLRSLALVASATQREHDLTEKEELAAFHTTMTHITTQLEEELAAARAERESTMEEAWARLALSMKDHEFHTASLRGSCANLNQRVANNQKSLRSINQTTKEMQTELDELRSRLKQESYRSDSAQELQHLKSSLQVLRASLATQHVHSRTVIKAINKRGYDAKKRLEEMQKQGRAILELASACARLETSRDRNVPFMPQPPRLEFTAEASDDGSLRTRLVPAAPDPDQITEGTLQPIPPQEFETQMGLSSVADEGVGTSITSSKTPSSKQRAPLRKISSVLELDDGVGSSLGPLSAAPTASGASTSGISLPKLAPTPPARGVSGRGKLGRDKLARISELLYHEEATQDAQEAIHAPGSSPHPLPDFVLQEAECILKTHDDLRNFWHKYHHVQLERLALRSETDVLRQENRHLKGKLKNYFISLGVTDAALGQTSAPVTISHFTISFTNTPRSRRRSRSVPTSSLGRAGSRTITSAGSAMRERSQTATPSGSMGREGGHTITTHEDGAWGSPPPPPPEVLPIQEARHLVRISAMHTAPRIRTC
ncbi:dynein regulatory complex subunit 2 [Macrobrachium rosenbergii]|uniref:dynein regulatory complex subunit 2 n=1 Tax=Macrobrachium rosenbergii TaxID=79674 RepID=UPI0034D73BBC